MRATARRASCKSRAMRAAASSAAVSRESPHSSSTAWRLSGISAARLACIRVAPHGCNSREVRGIGGGGGQSSSHCAGACGERRSTLAEIALGCCLSRALMVVHVSWSFSFLGTLDSQSIMCAVFSMGAGGLLLSMMCACLHSGQSLSL